MDYKDKRLKDAVERDIERYKATKQLPTERKRVSARPHTVSFDALPGSVKDELAIELHMISSSSASSSLDILGQQLADAELKILGLLTKGMSRPKVAEVLNISREEVTAAVAKARKVLRDACQG